MMNKKYYLGADGGKSDGLALLSPNDTWDLLEPVRTLAIRRRQLLDVNGNLELLRRAAALAGGVERVVVLIEKAQPNPGFGAVSSMTIGACSEFWRVVLTLEGFAFSTVHARTWQKAILTPFRGNLKGDHDTKEAARLYVTQRYPKVTLHEFGNAKQEAIRDAMCIALWGRALSV
jgi:hypothetical protein